MTDKSDPTPDTPTATSPTAERIAKVMSRAGVASRREAERMIIEGRVTVNGQVITSPALDVLPSDRITVDGKKLDEKQETRLWLYYKPVGLVTSESDEKGRQTVFDALPRDLPRVMSVGRLDLNSEGLLLLTNDGGLKRRLELPTTGWLRRYRVRVNGQPSDLTFAPLRRGATIDGEEFAPMEIRLDGQQGANAWLTVGIREGRNREIRRAMAHVGLQVNRLIRIAYGPFRLTGMEKNEVVEVKRRVLRDQLGGLLEGEEATPRPDRPDRSGRRGDAPRRFGARASGSPDFGSRESGSRDFGSRDRMAGDSYKPRGDRPDQAGSRAGRFDKPADKPFGKRFPKDGDQRPKAQFTARARRDDEAGPAARKDGKPRFNKSERSGPERFGAGSGRMGQGKPGQGKSGPAGRPGRPQGGGPGRKPRSR